MQQETQHVYYKNKINKTKQTKKVNLQEWLWIKKLNDLFQNPCIIWKENALPFSDLFLPQILKTKQKTQHLLLLIVKWLDFTVVKLCVQGLKLHQYTAKAGRNGSGKTEARAGTLHGGS